MKKTKCFIFWMFFGVVVLLSSGGVIADPGITGCVACWDFQETTGDTVFDSSGNGKDALLVNGPSRTAGGTLTLDGIDDYVSAPFIINPADTPFSVFAWIKGGSAGEQIICQGDGDGLGRAWLFVSSNDKLGTLLQDGQSGLECNADWDANFWHHVGIVWDGEKRYIYLDGAMVAADSDIISSLESSNGKLFIGAHKSFASGNFWDGEIDNVCIYNRVLTDSEIRRLVILPGSMGRSDSYIPDGTEARPYLIEDMTDFELFAVTPLFWNYGIHVRLDCDIDLSGFYFDNSVIAQNSYSDNIADYDLIQYLGVFNGNSHVISNIEIVNTKEYYERLPILTPYIPQIGLFSNIGSNGVIRNLFIIDSEITSYSGSIGILAGYNGGLIENCHVFDSDLVNYDQSTGGLVGVSQGDIYRSSSEDIFIFAFPTSSFYFPEIPYSGTGGLVGSVYSNGTSSGSQGISYSFSSGMIYGTDNVGGLVGHFHDGDISNSYSLCDVTGDTGNVGGFIGYISGDIDKCYSAGRVTTGSNSKEFHYWCCFYGYLTQSGDISNCFWDKELARNMDYQGQESGVTALTTSEMYDASFYKSVGWNFAPLAEDFWVEQSSGYPILSWQVSLIYDQAPVVEVIEAEVISTNLTLSSKVDIGWEITGHEVCPWITSISPDSGTIHGYGQVAVQLEVDSSGLSVGSYSCVLNCKDSFGGEQTIPVVLKVYNKVDIEELGFMSSVWGLGQASLDKSYRNIDWSWDDKIDIDDLTILAETWLGKFDYISSHLLLNWQFNNQQDFLALDSTGNNLNGILRNEPRWHNKGWMIFDGEFDYIQSPYILNPTDGPFSVFAWVQGGDPKGVILSQADGAGVGRAWLGILGTNKFATTLQSNGAGYLESNQLWDYGLWHHVGFVLDGTKRHLYIDGVEVAGDPYTLNALESSNGVLYAGTYKSFQSENYWNGQIDDLRIYKHALSVDEINNIIALRVDKASLLSHYEFETIVNGIAVDSIGNNDGNVFGDVYSVPGGPVGNAASFDGDGDYVELPVLHDSSISEPLCIFTWIKGGVPGDIIFCQKDGSNYDPFEETGIGRIWLHVSGNGNLGTAIEGENRSYLESDAAWDSADWHHVGIVWDGRRRNIYLDGVVVASDTDSIGQLSFCDGNFLIGTHKSLETSYFWNGEIDDVRVYKELLSAQEIAELAAAK